jgi:hypothetical protein
MMLWIRRLALALLGRYGATLRFPHLLLIAGALFGIDLLIPDGIPFLDEVFLALMTLMFAVWRGRGPEGSGDERDEDAPGEGGGAYRS